MPGTLETESNLLVEGSAVLDIEPSGREKGPGKKAPVFYNPAMRLNRDLTILILQGLVNGGGLPGRDRLYILDGLCGTAVKSIRLSKEVDWGDIPPEIHACDTNRSAMEAAKVLIGANDVDVILERMDINENLYRNRYSFIDIDPFGSPVPYAVSAFRSIIPGGVIAFTATDTAALSGSIPRVTLRRYGVKMVRTEFLKEMSCRVLMSFLSRTAASLGLSLRPLLFYAMDHYVRGFLRVERGARKADEMLDDLTDIHYAPPSPPGRGGSDLEKAVNNLGPLWMGALEDPELMIELVDLLHPDGSLRKYMGSPLKINRMLEMASKESDIPPFGYDTDMTASRLSSSPPPLSMAIECLKRAGFRAVRSRFGDKMIRTDADWDSVRTLIAWR